MALGECEGERNHSVSINRYFKLGLWTIKTSENKSHQGWIKFEMRMMTMWEGRAPRLCIL